MALNFRKALLCAVLVLGGLTSAVAAAPEGDVRTGRLENGLTYYIRRVETSPGRAGLSLVQNVGSMMEEDSQRGLAHFLEHMAFNASEAFPGRIDRFLHSRGIVTFNAYTGYDETVYTIDEVPTGDRELLDSCILILKEWSHALTLPEEGIEKERGIILEEWRMRRDAVARAREQIVGELYNHSLYAEREVIGDREVLENFTRKELVDYYKRWYRPDLQAVVIVGDIDAGRVEAFVREHFSLIPAAPSDAPERPRYRIGNHDEPKYVRAVDSGLGAPAMEFTRRFDAEPAALSVEEVVRRVVLRDCFNNMMAARLSVLTMSDEETVYGASVELGPLVRDYDVLTMTLQPYPGRDFMAVYDLFCVWETVRRDGFTPQEFERQMRRQLRQADAFDRNAGEVGYDVFSFLYRTNFLERVPVVEPSERGELMRRIVGELTLEDLNSWIAGWSGGDDNWVYVVSGSDEDYDYLPLEAVLDAGEEARESDPVLPPFVNDDISLIDFELEPAPVVREKRLPVGDGVLWEFGNGARVVFRNAESGLGRFRMTAFSDGGLSLVADDDLPSAGAVEHLAFASGVYDTDRSAMIQLMQHHEMEIGFRLQERREVITGEAMSDEAEMFFELLHLGLTRPRFDESEFARYTNSMRLALASRSGDPMVQVAGQVRELFVETTPRTAAVDMAYVDRMELDRVRRIFRERFCAPEEFTFYIVGDLSEREARRYAERYIGTLPSAGVRPERAVEHKVRVPKGDAERVFEVERHDAKADVDISFMSGRTLNRRERVAFWLAGAVLNSRCKDEIRDRRGGTYDITVSTRYDSEVVPHSWVSVGFETGTDRVEEMKEAFYAEWNYLLEHGVTEADVESVVTARKQQIAEQRKGIEYWMNALYRYVDRGDDVTREGYEVDDLERMTPEKVRSVIRRFAKDARRVEVVIKNR